MDKLQELTQKLYEEGLAKGKEEGIAILEKARKEAESIVTHAEAQAHAIMEKAHKEAAEYRTKVESDLRMAAQQSLQATKQDLENAVVGKMTGAPLDNVLSSEDFMKEIIRTVASRFSTQESQDLALILPEKFRESLEPFVSGELSQMLGKGIETSFSKKVAGGFRIGPKDGSYFISLTDETFRALISEYLRPAAKKLLFGE